MLRHMSDTLRGGTTLDRVMARMRISLLIALVLAVSSCGGSDGVATTTGGTATTTSPTTIAPSSTSTVAECDAGERPETSDIAWVLADPDGNGVEDRLVGYAADGWAHLRVEFEGGGSIDVAVEEFSGRLATEPIGGHDLDGDGDEELFSTVGWGAYTFVVGVWIVDGCDLVRVTLDDAPASFPVGASVANVSGLRCPDVGGLEEITASSPDGETFEGEVVRYALEGSVLVPTDSARITLDGDEAGTVPSIRCADFTMSAPS